MTDSRNERGATLVEVLVAAALLATISAGAAALLVMAHRLSMQAERSVVATTLAVARLQALRAVPFEYGIDGTPVDLPALAVTPPDALARDVSGCADVLDERGRSTSQPGAGGAAFVRRWAIQAAGAAGPETRALEVCVFAWPAPPGAPPLACVATVRARQS